MADPGTAEQFHLDIAARPEHVATARLFVAVVARTLAVDEIWVDDLKLATSEVVTAIVLAGRHDTVTVSITTRPPGLAVAIGPVAAADLTLEAVGPDPVAVIQAVFPDVELTDGAVRFVAGPQPGT